MTEVRLLISIKNHTAPHFFAAGATSAEAVIAAFLSHRPEQGGEAQAPDCALVLLDFESIQSATSSYLKALLAPLIPSLGGDQDLEYYPIFCAITEHVAEEVDFLAKQLGAPFLSTTGPDSSEAQMHGSLDPALLETFEALLARGSGTAPELHHDFGAKTSPTAFNNRLTELHAKRLVKRVREGRRWIYQPVFEVIHHG